MRVTKTKNICFICGAAHSAPAGERCGACGALSVESAIVHLLVKYAGGGEKSAPESLDKLKFRRILTIAPPRGLDTTMAGCPLYSGVSAREVLSVRQAADGLPFDVILAFDEADQATAEHINAILAGHGILIARPKNSFDAVLGNTMTWEVDGAAVAVYHKRNLESEDFTGERFMPGIEDRKLEIEHMQRYMSVRPLVKGLDVLDLACGEGYGSAFLAETAASVLGVDIDRDTVERAAVKYKRDNLRYRQGDAARIPLEDRSVDAVVSFETIEHIDETLQHQFLKEINRVLKEDGILIMSTPNKAVYSDRYDYFNEFHIHEFYLDEFLDFLRAYFPFVKLYQQSFQVVSLLSGCGDTPEAARWYGNAVGTEDAKYYIAVAARKAGRLPDVASVYVQGTGEYEEKTQRIVDLQNEETLRNLHIGNLDRELETRGARIRELQDEQAKRDAHIQELDGELEQKGGLIRDLQAEQAKRDAHIQELDGELEQKGGLIRDLQAEQAKRDAHIQELDGELEQKGKLICDLQAEQAKRDAHIQELDREMEARGARIQELQDEEAKRDTHIQELDGELEQKGELIRDLQAEQAKRDAHIQELDREMEARGARIRELQDEEAKRAAHIQNLDGEIEEKNGYIRILRDEKVQLEGEKAQLEGEKAQLEGEKAQLEGEKRDLETMCDRIAAERDLYETQRNTLVGERDDLKGYLADSKAECEELKKSVEEKNVELNNKQGHINLLLESDRELQNIKRSLSYRMYSKWWKLRDTMAPPNTRRRLVLKLGVKFLRHPIWCLRKVNPNRVRKFAEGMKSGEIATTAAKLDTCIGGDEVNTERPEQLPLVEFESIEAVPALHVPCASHPAVSIVIPVYNQFAYTYACLKSIAKNSGDVPYEVIIADDCSTDLTKQIGRAVSGIRVVRTRKNLRFLLNCNNAAKQAKGKNILFLNNDTQVMPNWLEPLVTLIERDEKIGMVGSKLIYPDGRLQEAGGILWRDGSAWNYGHLQDPAMPEYNYVKEADYISGAAIMIRADLWRQLGGFDERFAPAYCEDSDLAFEVRKAGYKVLFQPKSVVIHYEGVSNGTDTSTGLKAYQVENSKKFYEKWKDTLELEHNPNGVNPFLARDRSLHKKTLLFVDHYVPMYDKDAGSRTIIQYLKLFATEGYNIKFIGDNFFPHQPYTEVLQQMGIEVLVGSWYMKHWVDWLRENGESIKYVWLNRPHISEKYVDALRQYTHAYIAYYGMDLVYLREMRRYETTGDEEARRSAESWKPREFNLMRKMDVSYFLSQVEIEEVKKEDPSIKTHHISINIFDNLEKPEYKAKDREGLLFIGGFTHDPNVDCVKFIHDDIFPILKKRIPGIKMHIVGSNAPQSIVDMNAEDFIVHGYVSDEKLKQLYRNTRIAFIPLRYGAGVKGKVIEAMMNGVPVVTTQIGAEGIEGVDGILQCAETAQALVDTVEGLYSDERRLETLSEASFNYVVDAFSSEAAKRKLRDDFGFEV